ncbi:MAG TPA: hypothetical protein VFA07_08770 [Chthonomonadaceae bacterium]|nr:hypothetical protein [Chthonomonadaceae bacterium]
MRNDNKPSHKALLQRTALRAEHDPFYLASALAAYREAEQIDDTLLAAFLACTPDDLPRLALCRRPGTLGQEEFHADVTQIAAHFGLHADRLAGLLRRVDFLEEARRPHAAPEEQALLLAARDAEEAKDTEEENAEKSGAKGGEPSA